MRTFFIGKMKYKGLLFCTDLDGTLFDDKRQLSYENRQAIEYFKANGGIFTFITGRVPLTAVHIYNDIKPNAPYGCMNGAAVYDGAADRYLMAKTLADGAKTIATEALESVSSISCHLNTKSGLYFLTDNDPIEKLFKKIGTVTHRCRYDDVSEPVIKIVFSAQTESDMSALIAFLNAHPLAHRFDFVRSEQALYEILPKGANKGSALCDLASILNIDMKNTIAAGDYNNDISMIKAAGTGYAVSNAVDELKAVADRITVSNNEHAIARIIEEL